MNSSTEMFSGLLPKYSFKKFSSKIALFSMKLIIVFFNFFLLLENTVLISLLNSLKSFMLFFLGINFSVVDLTLGAG